MYIAQQELGLHELITRFYEKSGKSALSKASQINQISLKVLPGHVI